jgi:hypothetical protein
MDFGRICCPRLNSRQMRTWRPGCMALRSVDIPLLVCTVSRPRRSQYGSLDYSYKQFILEYTFSLIVYISVVMSRASAIKSCICRDWESDVKLLLVAGKIALSCETEARLQNEYASLQTADRFTEYRLYAASITLLLKSRLSAVSKSISLPRNMLFGQQKENKTLQTACGHGW